MRSYLHRRGSNLRWRQFFKPKRSPPLCSHFSITGRYRKEYNNLNTAVFLKTVGTLILPTEPPKLRKPGLPDNRVTTDNELGFGVPLVVCDVVMSLQPNPLLTFGQEAIVARFPLSKLHYWKKTSEKRFFRMSTWFK